MMVKSTRNMCVRLPGRRNNMQPKKKKGQTGITALYCRLSRDDGADGDSNSVSNHDVLYKGRFYPSNTS